MRRHHAAQPGAHRPLWQRRTFIEPPGPLVSLLVEVERYKLPQVIERTADERLREAVEETVRVHRIVQADEEADCRGGTCHKPLPWRESLERKACQIKSGQGKPIKSHQST